MARAVKTAASAKPTPSARKTTARPAAPTMKGKAAPIEKPVMTSPRGAAKSSRSISAPTRTSTPAPTATAAPKLSKDELRAQVTKLEGSNATLRTKSREANRTIKAANSRIAELETELAELQGQMAAAQAKTEATKAPKAPRRARATHTAATHPDEAGPREEADAEAQPLAEEAPATEDVSG